MKVVHLATTLEGGAGTGLWRYHCALQAAKVDSRILVMAPPAGAGPEVSAVHWRKRSLAFRIVHRLGWTRTTQEILQHQVAALDRSAKTGAAYELFTLPYSDYRPEDHPWVAEADVINLHWVAGFLDWPRFFARVLKPVVITLHDQQPYLGGFHYECDVRANPHLAALEARLRDVKQRALQSHRLQVLANSRWNAQQAVASGFFPPGTPVETVYYPLDTTIYAPRPRAAAKSAAGVDPVILVVGFACENLNNERKGFADLLQALALLPAELGQRVTLLSFGRDPKPELRARVNLSWRHLGYLRSDESKAAAYAAMDVFVVPSRAEAFGLTAIEAEACGVPVVATPVGGLVEAVPYAAADYPPGGSVAERLRDAIVTLLEDPVRRQDRAHQGREAVVAQHDPLHIGRRLADLHHRATA